ncbi:Ribonuclease toxin YhaV [Dirofilaria immitis]
MEFLSHVNGYTAKYCIVLKFDTAIKNIKSMERHPEEMERKAKNKYCYVVSDMISEHLLKRRWDRENPSHLFP